MISMTDPSTFLRLVRRSAVLALGLVGGATSVSLSAQTAEPLDFATQVVVSRNEVRVYFAPETPSTWDSLVAAGGGNGPASRLVISPRPTSMIAGTPLTFSVRLLDHLGRTIDGPVIQLKWDTYVGFVRMATDTVGVTFTQPGRHWVTASLRMHTDSVSVDVLPANRAP